MALIQTACLHDSTRNILWFPNISIFFHNYNKFILQTINWINFFYLKVLNGIVFL